MSLAFVGLEPRDYRSVADLMYGDRGGDRGLPRRAAAAQEPARRLAPVRHLGVTEPVRALRYGLADLRARLASAKVPAAVPSAAIEVLATPVLAAAAEPVAAPILALASALVAESVPATESVPVAPIPVPEAAILPQATIPSQATILPRRGPPSTRSTGSGGCSRWPGTRSVRPGPARRPPRRRGRSLACARPPPPGPPSRPRLDGLAPRARGRRARHGRRAARGTGRLRPRCPAPPASRSSSPRPCSPQAQTCAPRASRAPGRSALRDALGRAPARPRAGALRGTRRDARRPNPQAPREPPRRGASDGRDGEPGMAPRPDRGRGEVRDQRPGRLPRRGLGPAELSTLTLAVNGTEVGAGSIQAPQDVRTIAFAVPSGLLARGVNAVRLTVEQRHRVDCSVAATHELWTQLDATRTGLLIPPEAAGVTELADLAATLPGPGGAVPVRIVLPEGRMSPRAAERAVLAAQALAVAGRFAEPSVDFGPPAAGFEGLNLAVGPAALLAPLLGAGSSEVAGPRLVLLPRGPERRATLVATGRDDAEVDDALAMLTSTGAPRGTPAGVRASPTGAAGRPRATSGSRSATSASAAPSSAAGCSARASTSRSRTTSCPPTPPRSPSTSPAPTRGGSRPAPRSASRSTARTPRASTSPARAATCSATTRSCSRWAACAPGATASRSRPPCPAPRIRPASAGRDRHRPAAGRSASCSSTRPRSSFRPCPGRPRAGARPRGGGGLPLRRAAAGPRRALAGTRHDGRGGDARRPPRGRGRPADPLRLRDVAPGRARARAPRRARRGGRARALDGARDRPGRARAWAARPGLARSPAIPQDDPVAACRGVAGVPEPRREPDMALSAAAASPAAARREARLPGERDLSGERGLPGERDLVGEWSASVGGRWSGAGLAQGLVGWVVEPVAGAVRRAGRALAFLVPGAAADPAGPEALAGTALLMAQGAPPAAGEGGLTLVAAPSPAALAAGVACLVDPRTWSHLAGRLSLVGAEGLRSVAAEAPALVETRPLSLGKRAARRGGLALAQPAPLRAGRGAGGAGPRRRDHLARGQPRTEARMRALLALALMAVLACQALPARAAGLAGSLGDPEAWRAYRTRFVTAQGRVVDTANGGVSHSEGQGYGMLLAVAANDRRRSTASGAGRAPT